MDFIQIKGCERNDIVAAAFIWTHALDEQQQEIPITWRWLSTHCNFAIICNIPTDTKLTYLSPKIIKQFNDQRPKFAEIETTGSGARSRDGRFANSRHRSRGGHRSSSAKAIGFDGATDSGVDYYSSPSPDTEQRPRKRQRRVVDDSVDSDTTMGEEDI